MLLNKVLAVVGIVLAVAMCILSYTDGNTEAASAWGVAALWASVALIGHFRN